MGRTSTPTYRVEICGFSLNLPRGIGIGPTFWTREMGRPTAENLEKILRHYQASTLPGGANAHLGPQPLPAHAVIVRQSDATTVAEFKRV
jgi:hypothetical protein